MKFIKFVPDETLRYFAQKTVQYIGKLFRNIINPKHKTVDHFFFYVAKNGKISVSGSSLDVAYFLTGFF